MCVSGYISYHKCNNHNQTFIQFSHSHVLQLYHSFSAKPCFKYRIFIEPSPAHICHSTFSEQPLLAECQEGVSTNLLLRRQKIP